MSFDEEAEFVDSGGALLIFLTEVIEVSKKLSSKASCVDEIFPEMLKALDFFGLSWLTCLFNVTLVDVRDSAFGLANWDGASHFQEGDWRIFSNIQVITLLS